MRRDLDRPRLVVATDHARATGAVAGLEDPGAVLDRVLDAGADAVTTSCGVVERCRGRLIGRAPTYLQLDGGPSFLRERWLENTEWALLRTLDDAARLGVDGVCLSCTSWGWPASCARSRSSLGSVARRWRAACR